jgi:hypothetical protein
MSQGAALLLMFVLGAFGGPFIAALGEISENPRAARAAKWLGTVLGVLFVLPGLVYLWIAGVMQ